MLGKRLPIADKYLQPPFDVILTQGLSLHPSCRKITVADLQDHLNDVISNRVSLFFFSLDVRT